MELPQSPKGTRDFYPEDQYFQDYLFSSWRRTCARYGFEPYEGPMFEHLALFTQKSGDEIEKQLYSFEDKGGRMIALRPELTPTLARMVAAKGTELRRPVRWYATPRLFRYEKMQKGRLREFHQLNMDILGVAEVTADAELIAAAVDMMRDLGFTAEEFSARISSRLLLEQVLVTSGVDAGQLPALYALLDRKSKLPGQVFADQLAQLIPDTGLRGRIDGVFSARTLDDVRGLAPDVPALLQLSQLFGYLGDYGMADFVQFDIGIVRGLAYYTGIVFELFDTQRSMRAIAGGGRYDHLVKSYGGPDTPAVGFAAGDVVLGDMLREKLTSFTSPPRADVFVISMGEGSVNHAIRLTTEIRSAGISCEFALRETGVGKQFKLADAARARVAVISGDDERRSGVVKLKRMLGGDESTVPVGELTEHLCSQLAGPPTSDNQGNRVGARTSALI